jgi:hypothetical protein
VIYAKISYELILQKKFTESIIITNIQPNWYPEYTNTWCLLSWIGTGTSNKNWRLVCLCWSMFFLAYLSIFCFPYIIEIKMAVMLLIIMLSVNFFCNISSYDILAYITKNYIALIYYAKIVHLLCQFHAGKVGFSAVCQAIYS